MAGVCPALPRAQALTLLEKERLYLESCAQWNVEKTQLINDDEYETLKEDLEFEGSEVPPSWHVPEQYNL